MSSVVNVRERLPEGTHVIDPPWFDEAILGYSFAPDGGVNVAYSAEVCLDLVKRNMGLDTEAAAQELGEIALRCEGFAPVFVWGLD